MTQALAPRQLPACCIAVATDLMACCEAAISTVVMPEEFDERLLEVTARAALFRWLSHCREHRRELWQRRARQAGAAA